MALTETEHIIAILSEECDEVSQRALKALRFGVDDIQAGQELTNKERLIYELCDLMAVVEMLQEIDVLPSNIFKRETIFKKKMKVAKYMEYAKGVGTLK